MHFWKLNNDIKSHNQTQTTKDGRQPSLVCFTLHVWQRKFSIRIYGGKRNYCLLPHEIKDLAEGKVDPISPRDMLEIMITSTNTQCPMQIENGMIMSSVSLEGNNFVYNYSVDENLVSIEAIKQNKSAVKANIKQILSSNDMTVKQMVKICKEANTGIVYRYIGDVSGDVCIIKFSSSEL